MWSCHTYLALSVWCSKNIFASHLFPFQGTRLQHDFQKWFTIPLWWPSLTMMPLAQWKPFTSPIMDSSAPYDTDKQVDPKMYILKYSYGIITVTHMEAYFKRVWDVQRWNVVPNKVDLQDKKLLCSDITAQSSFCQRSRQCQTLGSGFSQLWCCFIINKLNKSISRLWSVDLFDDISTASATTLMVGISFRKSQCKKKKVKYNEFQ